MQYRSRFHESMECNIGEDAIFLIHSEMLYFLNIFLKEDYWQTSHFYFTKNIHELFDTIL
jgi:hypothetical protein